MPIYYCPDCWHDCEELEELKDHMRKAHPERIGNAFDVKVDIFLEEKGSKKRKDPKREKHA